MPGVSVVRDPDVISLRLGAQRKVISVWRTGVRGSSEQDCKEALGQETLREED